MLADILDDRSIKTLQGAFPGQRLYVPKGCRWSAMAVRLRLLLGEEQANRLMAVYGGEWLEMPSVAGYKLRGRARVREAVMLLSEQFADDEIADLLGISDRSVREWRSSG